MKTILEHKTTATMGTPPGAVVLRHNPENTLHPYVTHWRNDQDGGYYLGHYFETLGEAVEDYKERRQRGY